MGIGSKRVRRVAAGVQYGALPFRIGANGQVSILLLTSRETRRWVIPKGWPIPGRTAREAAMQEAWEEAGLLGRVVGKRSLGSYGYLKRLGPSVSVPCTVKVFLFAVAEQRAEWPERAERQTRWFDTMEAAGRVDEAALAEMMLKAGAKLHRP